MPNVGQLLKQEIVRLAKKEVNASLQPSKKIASAHRTSIAQLKRQVSDLSRTVSALRKLVSKRPVADEAAADTPKLRFVAKGLASHRARLGLSAGDFGRLVGVSGQSVYNWEAGKSIPRASQLTRIAELRAAGKREVQAKLAAADSATRKRAKAKAPAGK